MATKTKRPKGQNDILSSLNTAMDALNLAKEATSVISVKAAFTSAGVLLTIIRDSMISKADYVELGLACADVCEALNRGTNIRRADKSVLEAIDKLTLTIEDIQRNIIKRGKRNAISRRYHARDDEETIATWRLNLHRILHVFNTGLKIDTHVTSSDTRQDTPDMYTTVPDVHLNAANVKTIVSDVRSDIANACTTGSDIHCSKLKSNEDAVTHASAPGWSLPPVPGNTHRTTSNVRRDVVSEVHRDLVNTQTMVSDLHRNMLKSQEWAVGQPQLVGNLSCSEIQGLTFASSAAGELPPPPPRILYGRDELIERIVDFTQRLTPIALIGAGGIGKTSIVLTVLHDDRIKQRFGDNRWFIRCDGFPASRTHFLRRLSKVIGAGIENPEDLTPLRRYLSSKEMVIVLDNAESILDPQGSNVWEIYAVVNELIRFSNICVCITSRISTIPPDSQILEIPTLPAEAAHDTFYRIYKYGERSVPINDILEKLDFHPLSITLLAAVAQYNKWDANRLTREWERQRTGVLHAQHFGCLATTIELSLASPMFRELGPDARGLLAVIAFFPQGVNEENTDWLLPIIPDVLNVFDKFCILSLTYRANGFVTMLAPLRDYLRPKDPKTSPLLGTTKEQYLSRFSAPIRPDKAGFKESRWIISEDVNVEHLLDVFTSVDANSEDVWDACADFMEHLYWHKPRLTMLGPKIEALPDNHPSKPRCLRDLSWLFHSVGNRVERKRILTHTLKLWRDQGDDHQAALTLSHLSDANRDMGLCKEGIRQAREASAIFERLGDAMSQAECLIDLARSLYSDEQLDAAEEAASRAVDLLPENDEQLQVYEGHHVLGKIYASKGETEKAVRHFDIALGIASSLRAVSGVFWIHFALAVLFSEEGRFNDARGHVEQAKSHAVNDAYLLAHASQLQAWFLDQQHMFEEAKSEASRALDMFEKLGATNDAEDTRELLKKIGRDAQGDRPGSG